MQRRKVILLLLLAMATAGCDRHTAVENKPEVIMGRDCGLDYFPCCAEDPSCSDAQQCCYDPNQSGLNYCADDCGCGKEKQFCCEGNSCDAGLACINSHCAACGQINQPCCENDNCNDQLVCGNGTCVECGITGNPCCNDGVCFNQDKRDESRSGCINGQCQSCGFGGNSVCKLEPKCLPGNLQNNEVCYFCGGDNQPCCNELSGVDYLCDPKLDLKCDLGFCSPNN